MPVCSSGISAPLPGVPAAIVVDQAYIQSLLPPALAWLYPYLPWMHGLQIGDVGAFCAVDPPTWSVPSASDIFQLITGGNIGQAASVLQFMQDITRAYLWYNLCHCTTVTTPAPPTAPSAPSDLPAINPPGLVTTPSAPCGVFTVNRLATSTQVVVVPIQPMPVGWTDATISVAVGVDGTVGSPDVFFFRVDYYTGNGTGYISSVFEGFSTNAHGSTRGPIQHTPPSGANYFDIQVYTGGAYSGTISGALSFVCGSTSTPSSGVPQCCTSTDPLTQSRLQSLLDMVTLIQRQLAPFAYVTGPAHSALSGSGSISVQGVLGVLLNTSIPSRAGEVIGTPDTAFDVGWINFGTADGYTARRFITSDSQLVFPEVAGTWTIIGYTLLPGVTMTLTELVREP